MANDPQVPWTDEQWARVNQVIQEEAKRARTAATFLPLYGPLSPDSDYVRQQGIAYTAPALPAPPAVLAAAQAQLNNALQQYQIELAAGNLANVALEQQRIAAAEAVIGRNQLNIADRDTIRLATLQVTVPVRGAQMADPELSSTLALFRRAANVVARLEDAVVFRGLAADPLNPGGFAPPGGLGGLPRIWQITGAQAARGIWTGPFPPPGPWIIIPAAPIAGRGQALVGAISNAIGQLEQNGQFGPFAVVLGQQLFLVAQTPDPGSLVLPQDRIVPFLGGGPLLRTSTLDDWGGFSGVVIALGGAPVELVVATDVCLQFLQLSLDPAYYFRVSEKIALRIKEPQAIVQLYML